MSQTLEAHISEHDSQQCPYDCDECEQRFFFPSELENHSLWHASANQTSDTTSSSELVLGGDDLLTTLGVLANNMNTLVIIWTYLMLFCRILA